MSESDGGIRDRLRRLLVCLAVVVLLVFAGNVVDGVGNAIADASKNSSKIGKLASCIANSFTTGTLVVMADGTTKPIQDVQIGDLVLATDPETGETAAEPVTTLITGHGNKNLVKITTDDNGELTATDGHPFWTTNKGWTNANNLQPGDRLTNPTGQQIPVKTVNHYTQQTTVHNLTINRIHTYYTQNTGKQQTLVHNCAVGPPRNNQAQNEQFRKAIQEAQRSIGRVLSKAERREVHDAISGQRYGYHEIVSEIKEMFKKK